MTETIKTELKSMLTTFVSEFILEAGIFLLALYNGDFSIAVLSAIASGAFRSIIKTVLRHVFPDFFTAERINNINNK